MEGSILEKCGKYGEKMAVFPDNYGRIGVYRVKLSF